MPKRIALFTLFAFIILSKLVYSSRYLRMNPKQMYYDDNCEDPNKLLDIASWVKMDKPNMHFM